MPVAGPYFSALPAQAGIENPPDGAGSASRGVFSTEGMVRLVGTKVKTPRVGVETRCGKALNDLGGATQIQRQLC